MPAIKWIADGAVEFVVEMALSPSSPEPGDAIWDLGLWDVDNWAGGIPTWVTVTTLTEGLNINRGRDRWETAFRVGTAQAVMDNDGGQFNPSTGIPLGDLELRPGRWLRVLARVPDATNMLFPVFVGQIDDLQDRYATAAGRINSRVDVSDFLSRFNIEDPPPLTTPIPAGQFTDQRVDAILNRSDWPKELRDVQVGVHTMSESTLPQNDLAELQAAATAEGGAVFIDKEGRVAFKARDWLETDPRSTTPQFAIGGVGDEIQILKATTSNSVQRVFNDIQLSRVGGTAVEVEAADSKSLYGTRTFRRLDIQAQNDTQIQALADRFLAAFRYDRLRLEEIDVFPLTPAAAEALLEAELGDRITVAVRTLRGWSYTDDYWINRIIHNVTAEDWVTTFRLDTTDLSSPLEDDAFSSGFSSGFDAAIPGGT